MKRVLQTLLLFAALLVPWATQAQSLEEYQVTTDTTTFTSIASTGTALSFSSNDDGYATVTLPFAMPYGGSSLASGTTIACSANGFMYLGASSTSGTTGTYSSTSYLAVNPIMQQDAHIGRYTESGAYWSYDGTSAVKSLTIEYYGLGTYSSPYGFYTYQVVFYENGNIEFIYDSVNTGTTSTRTFATYLTNGPDNDRLFLTGAWANPTVSSSYATRPNSPLPARGLRYTFTRPTITCPRPTMLALDTITTTEMTLYWTHGGTETAWVLQVGDDEYYPTDTFYTVNNLTPNTLYNVAVRAICGNNDTSAARMASYRTECSAISASDLPYMENFESYGSGSSYTIPCWAKGTSNTSTAYPYPTSTVVNGTRSLYFYGYHPSSGTATYCWAALPPIDDNLDMSDLQLNFLVKRGSTASSYYTTLLYVGIADAVDGFTSATAIESGVTWIDTINHFSDAASSIHSEEVVFSNYTGTGKYVVIYCPVPPLQGSSTYAYNYAYVDDVTLRTIPSCFWPAEVEAVSIEPNNAVISWTPDSRTTNPTGWIVEYDTAGFTPGQGTTVTVTDTTVTLAGLDANTVYDVYISANCGGGDVSDPAVYSFRTRCEWIDQMPYTEDFESSGTGGSTSTAFVECMSRLNNATVNFGYPYVTSTASYVHGGTHGTYWYHSTTTGTYGDYQMMILPGVDPTAYDISDLTLSFWAKTTGASYHPTPIVGVMTNPLDVSTFTPVYTFTSTEVTTDWNIYAIPLSSYTGNGNYIAIKWDRTSATSYLAIDDIFLTDEWCDVPENVSATPSIDEVTVSWTAVSGASYTVYLGTDTVQGVSDAYYTFDNLAANTQYTYGVMRECSNGNSMPMVGSVRTLCNMLDSLPYSYGFEGLATGSSTVVPTIPCWQHLNNATQYFGYPYVSSTSHLGSRSLYWYASTTQGTYGDYQIMVLPGVDTNLYPVNRLMLKFWAKSSSTSYHPIFQVGVMTNPVDATTFQQVATVDVGAGNTTWTEFSTTFAGYHGNGQFVAVRALRPTSSWYAYTDDFTLEALPSCPPVVDLEAGSVTAGAALLTWNYQDGSDEEPTSYSIVVVDSSNLTTTYTTPDQYYLLTGLDANAPYTVYVSTNCGNAVGGTDSVTFSTNGLPCLVADPTTSFSDTLVNGTATSSYIPSYSTYNYSLTQQIFTAAEIGHGGTISSVKFMPSAFSVPRTLEVYMGHVNVATATAYLYPSDLTMVYNSGTTVSMTAGQWNELQLSTPFDYNGTDNLLIMVRDMTGSWTSGNTWYGENGTSGVSRYVYQDGSAYPIGFSGGTTSTFRSNLIIAGMGCAVEATCANPAIAVTRTDTTEIDLTWVPGYTETSWNIEYRVAGASAWTPLLTGTAMTDYTVTDLTPGTEYEFRVSHTCDTITYSATTSAFTNCVPAAVPFTEGFEDWTSGTSGTVPNNCWYKFTNYSTTYYPYVSNSYSHTGNNSMYMYTYTYSSYAYFSMPELNAAIDSLQVSFWLYKSSSSYPAACVQVGVMTDPQDYSTFVSLGSATPVYGDGWTMFDVNLNNYSGTGKHIAFAVPTNTSVSYPYIYLDDITVDYIPSCPHITNLHSTNASDTTITVAWTAGGDETSWIVSDGINEYATTTPSFTFTGLYGNTLYTIGVRPVCTDGDTGIVYTQNFRTDCPAYMTLPFSNDFENEPYYSAVAYADAFPSCWTRINDASGTYNYYPYLYATSTYAHSGNVGMYWYQTTTTTYANNEYAVLPAIDTAQTPMNMLSMSFYIKTTSTSYHPQPIVGVMSGTDVTTFDTVYAFTASEVTTAWQQVNIDFTNYTGTGNRIAIKWPRPSSASYMAIDDIEVWRRSSCPTPSYVQISNISNDQATVLWGDTTNGAYTGGATVYWGRINNIDMAEDSASVPAGTTSYNIASLGSSNTTLLGNTTYYVWVQGECATEPSRTLLTSFTTAADCMPVENLTVAGTDYYAFGLNWDAPSTAHPATAYIVSWKEATATTWTSDTTNNTYYYVSGLNLNTPYNYQVTTICNNEVSAANSGTVSTLGCGTLITDGGATYAYLPTQQFYEYSYTQQIYLANELTGVDTISHIAFNVAPGYTNDTRNVVVYLGNTSKSSFSSTTDYIPASALTQVYSGTMGGSDWIDLQLTSDFVRNADSNLVVVVDDNTGDYTSTIYWTSTATSSARSLYFYQDGTDITPAAPSAGSNGAVYYVNQILLAGPTCTTPACGAPIIFATNTGTNQIDITWNTEPGATYEVAYQQVGTTNWTVAQTANTTGVCSITGLTPSEYWTVRVRFNCNGDTLVGTRTVTTLCGPSALPLTENFQTREYGYYERNCWTTGSANLGTTYPYPYVTSLQGASDNKLCLFYGGGYLILPRVAAPLNELQIRFKLTQGGDNVRFLMGLIEDPTLPINAMTVLDTLIRSNIDTSMSTVNYTYSFENLSMADTGKYICFWDAFNDNYSFLDDIVVEYIPQCTPVTALATTTVGATTADITWSDNGSFGTGYIVEIGPRYFTPGDSTAQRFFTTSTSYSFTGLNHSTSYDVYVYTVCGGSGDTAIASQVLMFETECMPYTTLPYFTDFENIMSPGSSATNVVPNCWAAESAVGTMPHIYYTTSSGYTSSPTHCFYFYSNGVAALPEFGVPIDTLMISFHDYNSSPSGYGLIIGTVDSITPGFEASFTPIDTIVYDGNATNQYNVVSYLTEYTGSATRIAIKNYNTNSSSTYSYHYIDDLTVDFVPACIAPQHVRTTLLLDNQADLAWTISNASSYTVEYGAHGFTPGTGTVLTTTTRDVSITGLTAQTQYDVYLVSGCGSDTTFYTFTTSCAPVTLPFSEDFDSYTTSTTSATGVHVDCWDYIMTGSSSYQTGSYLPQIYYSSSYAHSGNYSYRLYGNGYHMLPPMPTSLDSLILTFWDYTTSASYGLEVGVMEGSTFIPVQVISSPASTHVEYEVFFNTYTGNSRTIAFRNYYTTSSTTYYSYHYIDNIMVDYVPSCPKVDNVHSSASGVTTITVDWTDRVAAPEWEIAYGTSATPTNSVVVTSHPYTIMNLDTLTQYYFYVRPICSSTDTGYWSAAALLSTGICENSIEVTTGPATGTTYYAPVNNYYRYTLTETIIDSAELAGAGDFVAIAYQYNYATPSTDKTDVTIWLQHTTKTTFSSTTDIEVLDTVNAVKVYEGHLNCVQGWNIFGFIDSTTFTWDGHSNVMVIVDDNSYDYNGNAYVFAASACTGTKTLHYYSDSYNPDPLAPASFSGTKSSLSGMRPTMKLISCGASCNAPSILPASNVTYQSATINWASSATDYEVSYKMASEGTWPAETAVSANSYDLTNLMPATTYQFRVRAICDADENLISDWAEGTFVTDSLPCFAPTELEATPSYVSASFDWEPGTTETQWNVHIWNSTKDTVVTVNAHPAVVGGLAQTTAYYAAVQALCGGGLAESDYSDTIQFTTNTCAAPTGVAVSNVTISSAVVTWNGNAASYDISYGEQGFGEGQGQTVTGVTGNTYTITGLEPDMAYDVYVRANCEAGVPSGWSENATFTTDHEGILNADGMNVTIYPNPTTSATTISLSGVNGEVEITIVDMNGRTVKSDVMSCDGDCAKKLTVDGLAAGAYFVRISADGVNAVKKLVVK